MSLGRPPLVDVHNHLIPGVDDGARSVEESMKALGAMHEQGVRRLAATPHLDGHLTLGDRELAGRMEELDAGWERLKSAAAERFPEVEIHRGTEVMLDLPQVRLDDPRTRFAGGRYVLVEFPRLFIPTGSADVLYNLRMDGYVPIVAHPERYANLDSGDLSFLKQWRSVGARFAVNAGSLFGGFGRGASTMVRELLREGWVDLIGSDYHARPGRPLLLGQAYDRLCELGGEEQARLLLSENPGRILDDGELHDVPPLGSGGWWGKLRSVFAR